MIVTAAGVDDKRPAGEDRVDVRQSKGRSGQG